MGVGGCLRLCLLLSFALCSVDASRCARLLQLIPFAIPFVDRIAIFRRLVALDQVRYGSYPHLFTPLIAALHACADTMRMYLASQNMSLSGGTMSWKMATRALIT